MFPKAVVNRARSNFHAPPQEGAATMHDAEQNNMPRTVWFHRWHDRLSGGQVKHADYFGHVRRAAGFAPKITFGNAPENAVVARERRALWPAAEAECVADWRPRPDDVFFLAGIDWRYLRAKGLDARDNPRINLVQHVRHATKGTELHGYLAERAIRVCVSAEVAAALEETGRVNGPLFTIPNGLDLATAPGKPETPLAERDRSPVLIVGYKRPRLAHELSARLAREGIAHITATGFLERPAFLRLFTQSAVAVCLPHSQEGFYLPALEAMASGCVTVTLDCVGNRGFCQHLRNCLVARDDDASLLQMIRAALDMPTSRRAQLLRAARDTVAKHTLESERERFQSLLANIDDLWRGQQAAPVATQASRQGAAPPARPLLDFAIVGAQKCGTTALRGFLGAHPDIAMCRAEVHLFDAPDYSPAWTAQQIDHRYRQALTETGGGRVRGECTPMYLFLPEVPSQLKRYNPRLKLVVLLRDPVRRAISAYYMEKGRGAENRPLWLALLLEPVRCRLEREPRAWKSAHRQHAYRRRGLYSKQLRNLYRHFDANQVLILRNADLRRNHDAVLRRVFRFLGVDEDAHIAPATVFASDHAQKKHRLVRLLLRATYCLERLRLARVLQASSPADATTSKRAAGAKR